MVNTLQMKEQKEREMYYKRQQTNRNVNVNYQENNLQSSPYHNRTGSSSSKWHCTAGGLCQWSVKTKE